MKLEDGNIKTFSFTEWLRTNIGNQNYDYLMLRSANGDLYFILKNESESRVIKVNKKTQEENTSEDIADLIRNGEELKQPHSMDMGLDHKIIFEKGRMAII